MGYLRSFLLVALLVFALPAQAQQADEAAPGFSLPPSPAPQPVNPRQQGPELDAFRARDTPVAPPPVAVPPVVIPTITPTPAQSSSQAQPSPQVPTQRRTPAPTPATRPDPAPATIEESSAPRTQSAPTVAPEPPLPVPAPTATLSDAPLWPWIIGGALALLTLVIVVLLLRRRRSTQEEHGADEVDPAPPEPVPESASVPAAPPSAPVPAAPDATDRPWLDMTLEVTQARYSVMGITIGYTLLLHNRGDTPAQDVLVRGIIGNAGAQQQALLQAFFAGQSGLPFHAVVSIIPGETRRLTGELRLMPDQIVPVAMGQRSLMIPLAAFDATYRWGPEEDAPQDMGRTARAFILGQEQEPRADRLAPFRLDQGPRQYRRAATRAAAELIPS